MRILVAILICLFLTSIGSGMAQMFILILMSDRIEKDRPDIGIWNWRMQHFWRVVSAYRALYPGDRQLRRLYTAIAVSMICGIGIAVMIFGVMPRYALPSR